MLQTAEYLLSRDPARIIFLDGRPFSRRYQIENVLAVASSLHQRWTNSRMRVFRRDVRVSGSRADAGASSHPAGNRDFQLYADVKTRFETITHPKIVIDTDQGLEHCVASAMAALGTSA